MKLHLAKIELKEANDFVSARWELVAKFAPTHR